MQSSTVDTPDSGNSLVSQPMDSREANAIPLTSLESMLPLLKLLPALILEQNTYHLRGPISKPDFQLFLANARLVGEFTLSNKCDSLSDNRNFAPGTFVRLGQLQNRDSEGPLLPSLTRLRLTNPDKSSMSQLSLFFTPSLRSLEVTNVPKNQQSVLLSFLVTLMDEAPHVTTITLGPGVFETACLEACSNFKRLQYLELKEGGNLIDVGLLTSIGNLPELETFVLDDRIVGYNAEDGAYTLSTGFLRLRKLHITGTMTLIRLLHGAVDSANLQDLGLTLVRVRGSTPTPSSGQFGSKKKKPLKKTFEFVVDSTTEAFCNLFNHGGWSQTLKSIRLDHLQDYSDINDSAFSWDSESIPPELLQLPIKILDLLLEYPNLEDLEIAGWTLPESSTGHTFDDTLKSFRNLKTIRFPIGGNIPKIHLNELQSIAESCPNLISLQCGIETFTSFTPPPLSIEMPSHSLKVLSVGSSPGTALVDWNQKLSIAAFLDALFPNLERIETRHNSEQWGCIHDLVKMCQTSRLIHANRRSASFQDEMANDGAGC